MNKKEIEDRITRMITVIENPKNNTELLSVKSKINPINKGNHYIIPDSDKNYFGTMGGFHWEIKPLKDGNYQVMANDIWDLQPLKNQIIGNSDNFSGRVLNKIIKPFKNTEVGKALGIGKPLNVKVGFIYDPVIGKIKNTFGLAPAGILANELINKNK